MIPSLECWMRTYRREPVAVRGSEGGEGGPLWFGAAGSCGVSRG